MSLSVTDVANQISNATSPAQSALDASGPTTNDFDAAQQPSLAQTTAALSGNSPAPSAQPAPSSAPTPQLVNPLQGTTDFANNGGLMAHIRGFLYGLSGGGIPGAVEGAISPKSVQTNYNRQQESKNEELNFESSRASQAYAQAMHDYLVNDNLSAENKQKASERAIQFIDQIRALDPSIPAPTITEAHIAAVKAVTDNLQNQNGGTIPATFNIPIPSPDGQPSYLATLNLSAAAQAKTPPAYLSEYADKYSMDANLLQQAWAQGNTEKRVQLASQALSALHPQLDSSNPLGQILALQGVKRQWILAHTGKMSDADLASGEKWFDTNLDMLQSQYSDLKKGIAEQGKQDAQIKGQQAYSEAYNKTAGELAAQNAGVVNGVGGRSNLIDQIGQGLIAAPSTMFKGKEGLGLLQQVLAKYPDFDQTRADAYKKTREDFTSGKTAVGINSYNTAIAHLGTMFDHVSNTSSFQLNNPASDVSRQLDLDKQLVSTELAKAVSNNNLTEGEKNDILKSISGYTVNSYKTRIQEAVQLLHGKLESYQQQWSNGMPKGAVSSVPIVSPQSDATMAKISGQAQQSQGRAVRDGKGNVIGYTTDGKTMTPIGRQ